MSHPFASERDNPLDHELIELVFVLNAKCAGLAGTRLAEFCMEAMIGTMSKLLIAGSASLQKECKKWVAYWLAAGYEVIGYPEPISPESFNKDYPGVFKRFFQQIIEADRLFIMNEDKNGIHGYIGAEVFAEAAFAIAHNQLGDNFTKVIIMQVPDESVQSYDEIQLWLKLGWAELYGTQ